MAATPKNASAHFVGRNTGATYTKDIYLSDVAAALANWDSGQGASATSETFWTPPEPVSLVDYSHETGMADTTKVQVTRNGVPTGNIFRYIVFLTSLNSRPKLNLPFAAGDKIALVQLA